ncbi:MAG: CPBP family intramembrane glutamic endopeptidase [Caldilineaceae bacterium]
MNNCRYLNLFGNRCEGRLRALWRLLIVILLGLAGVGIFRLLATAIILFLLMLTMQVPFGSIGNGQELARELNREFLRFPLLVGVRSLIILSLIWLAFVLVAHWLDVRPWRDYGFHCNATWWRDLTFGLLVGVGLISMIFGVEYGLGWVRVYGMFENAQPQLPFWPLFVDGLFAFMLVGVQEELFARGYLIKNLAEGLHCSCISARGALFIAYLLTSLFFGFLHANHQNALLTSSLNLTVFGLFLGLAFILTHELAIPIGVHIGWNFAQGYIFGFPVSGANAELSLLATRQTGPAVWTGGAFGPEGGLIGFIAILLGMLLLYGWVRWTRRQVAVQTELARYAPLHQKIEGKASES